MRILALLARHGAEKYANAVDDLLSFYRRRLPDVEPHICVVDNSLDQMHSSQIAENISLIGASNAAWEFSAWDSGLARVGDRILDFDFVHLVTAAFQQLYNRYMDRIDIRMLDAVLGRATAIGHIDYYNEPVRFFGRASQSWIRTSFLFLPPTELRLLGSLVSVHGDAGFFGDDPERPFSPQAPIDEAYQANIIGWLTGDGTGQGVAWHSRFELTEETFPFFRAKTLAILNEHALTLRLRQQGCAPVDATWLASRMSLPRQASRLSAIPEWREQLSERDENAVIWKPNA